MKNILVAAIFLFSQLGFTAEKANQVKTTKAKTTQAQAKKKFQIEDLTFSQLLLTKDEIIHLSEEDQVAYIYAMMAMTQIIEGAQQTQMGYKDKVVTAQLEKSKPHLLENEKYARLFKTIFPDAHAWGFLVGLGARALTMFSRSAAVVSTAAEVGGSKLAAKAAAKAGTASKEALTKMSGTAKEAAGNLKKAQDDLQKAIKKNPGNTREETLAFNKAHSNLAKERQAFIDAGGTADQFNTAVKGSGLKRIMVGTMKASPMLAGGYLASVGLDTMLLEKTGFSIDKFIDENLMTPVSNWLTGTDLSGPSVPTPEQIKALKAGDSSRGVDKPCLFGGIASKWMDFGEQGILCTRPAEASNENCKQEDGKFQCPDYGFNFVSEPIKASLCIETQKTGNLTVRCGKTLRAVLESKAATLDKEEARKELEKNFGVMIAGLEANDRMKNEKGETKSIFAYCMADNVAQGPECGAVQEVITFLKSTGAKAIYESRPQLAQAAPAAAGAPTGSDPAADAAAAGAKQ